VVKSPPILQCRKTAKHPKPIASLKKSKFISKFKLTEKDRQYIQDKGIDTIRQHAIDFIKTRIAPQNPKNDGKQTPMKGHPVFIAQHATATCCRGCIQKWHGIKKGKELSDHEIQFLVELIMGWIERQTKNKS
jgi:exodeoxyribonuclease V alpha subunit